MAKTNPFEFIQQVRSEVSKVTWPSRRETTISALMVVVMAILAALFFLVVDQFISHGMSLLLGV